MSDYNYSIDPFHNLSNILGRLKRNFSVDKKLNNYLLHVLAKNIQNLNKNNVQKENNGLYFITLIAPEDFKVAADKLLTMQELKAYKSEIIKIKDNHFEDDIIKAHNESKAKEPMIAIDGKKYLEDLLIQEFIELLRKMYIPIKDFYGNVIGNGSAGDVMTYINQSNGMKIKLDPLCSNITIERIPKTTSVIGVLHKIVLHFRPEEPDEIA